MTDESGEDAKVLAVPIDKVTAGEYTYSDPLRDVPDLLVQAALNIFLPITKIWKKVNGLTIQGWRRGRCRQTGDTRFLWSKIFSALIK